MAETNDGKYIDADIMKKTFPAYEQAIGSENYKCVEKAVRNSAASLAVAQYKQALCGKDVKSHKNAVLIVGLPGSGKSEMVKSHLSKVGANQIFFEVHHFNSAKFKDYIGKALDLKVVPVLAVAVSSPLETVKRHLATHMVTGVAPTTNQDFARLHMEQLSLLRDLHETFGNKVRLTVLDVSQPDNPKHGWKHLDKLEAQADPDRLRADYSRAITQLFESGLISNHTQLRAFGQKPAADAKDFFLKIAQASSQNTPADQVKSPDSPNKPKRSKMK